MSSPFRTLRAAVVAVALLLPPPAAADLHLAGTAGAGFAYDRTYLTVGGLVGYGLGFGLDLELRGEYSFLQSPRFFKLAPGVTWYVPLPLVRPYLGAYYAHWFLASGFPDSDAVGARAGLALASFGPASVSVGAAYERRLSCARDCDGWWPEAMAGIRF